MQNNIYAREYEHGERGIVVHVSRKALTWYRRLVDLYRDEDVYNELIALETPNVETIDIITDRGAHKRVDVISKNRTTYIFEYSFRNSTYSVLYDYADDNVTVLDSVGAQFETKEELIEHVKKTARDIMVVSYFLYATGFEGKECTLQKFYMFGKSPHDLVSDDGQ